MIIKKRKCGVVPLDSGGEARVLPSEDGYIYLAVTSRRESVDGVGSSASHLYRLTKLEAMFLGRALEAFGSGREG